MVFSMEAGNDAQQFGIGIAGNTIQNWGRVRNPESIELDIK
jgi:hypothetical protein